MSTLLHSWASPDPTRARELIMAQPRDVARAVRVRREMNYYGIKPVGGASLQTWQEALSTAQADGAVYNTSVAETSLLPTGAVFTLPANFWSIGKTLQFWAAGRVSNTGTPTLRFRLFNSAVAIFDTTALTTFTVAANATWILQGFITCRSIGSVTAATVMYIGQLAGVVTSNTTTVQVPATAPAVSAGFDSTISNTVDLKATWGTSSASNTITLHQYVLEAMN